MRAPGDFDRGQVAGYHVGRMSDHDDILAAAGAYAAAFGAEGGLPAPPARRMAVLTCMDARIHPEALLGLSEGDAHVVRNAGGRASGDALRSLILSTNLMGVTWIVVIHHTDCAIGRLSNDEIRARLRDATGVDAADVVDFLPFMDLDESVVEDARAIREHLLIPGGVAIEGYVFDVTTGRLREVPAATDAGRPRG